MYNEVVTRLMETLVLPPRGGAFHVLVHARSRGDGRWEGFLEFRPTAGGTSMKTAVETTQSSSRAVLDWAVGLGLAFLEGAFERAYRQANAEPGRGLAYLAPLDGPLDPGDRGARIEAIAREILERFRELGTNQMRTDELFNRTTHANADLVRAFELLEKRWRFVVRRTVGGVDRLDLTQSGGEALGPAASQPTEGSDRPHPR
jgi:hypothetical protein